MRFKETMIFTTYRFSAHVMKKISSICFLAWFICFFLAWAPASSYGTQKLNRTMYDESDIITPRPKPQPQINGPLVYGCRPGHPFLYRIPCQGVRPVKFSVKGLPPELKLDASTGIITGTTPPKGEYEVLIQAANSIGKDKRKLKILAGDQLSLTPPMGWNSWYVHYVRIDDSLMRAAAEAMITSGMADVGYQYVNIDECWSVAGKAHPLMTDSSRIGTVRSSDGNILPNVHFPDMKAMTDYIHAKGLKAGIYSSPGLISCCGLTGSWQHEEQDAAQFAAWGFDFLKYDWCYYSKILGKEPSLEDLQKPYILMGNALKQQPRDIIFNLCQYGRGNVWEWGAKVGGHCWRTAGDLGFELDRFFTVAMNNAKVGTFSKPGAWNDPDYLLIGWIGSQKGETFTAPQPSPLTVQQQYSYMSLWCLMAAPLIFSGDMSKLDEFTLNVLCNPEVIEIDQDPLGKCGSVIMKNDENFIMIKDLADGSKAVGLFNRGKSSAEVELDWAELQLSGKQSVRDLWRQKELGTFKNKFSAQVPPDGVVMVKISKH
ncbi:MAG: alpha-galactosidase [Bacteroidota bacterium]|nr:alpha-galactosidase [Bacteroidota bacterium]